jgi:uncharacterized alpha-E superfamily protein
LDVPPGAFLDGALSRTRRKHRAPAGCGLSHGAPRGNSAASEEWRSVLITLGLEGEYEASGGDYTGPAYQLDAARRRQPGSVLAMIEARAPTRMVRTAITREVWEATNESWMLLKDVLAQREGGRTGHVLDLIRRQATAVRGAMEGTMLRNDIFNFARIGTHLERADNTAHSGCEIPCAAAQRRWVGSRLDNAQWEMVLRSVAGERAFRWLNAGALDPKGIAEFLILDGRFPRSLAYCYSKLTSNMEWLCRIMRPKRPPS